jgi:hypothetical protein
MTPHDHYAQALKTLKSVISDLVDARDFKHASELHSAVQHVVSLKRATLGIEDPLDLAAMRGEGVGGDDEDGEE